MQIPRLRISRFIGVIVGATLLQGCVVLSLQPAYDDESLAWDDALIGHWRNAEDNVEVTVERGEWRSYKIHYKHPAEGADFSARLTAIGDSYFLDLMPIRGLDYGAVLVPAHLVVRIAREGEKWTVSGLDYDRLRTQIKAGRLATFATFDERQNVLLTGTTQAIRTWLRGRSQSDFTAPAIFERTAK